MDWRLVCSIIEQTHAYGGYNPFVLCECYKTLYISLPSSAKQQREIT